MNMCRLIDQILDAQARQLLSIVCMTLCRQFQQILDLSAFMEKN